MKSDSSRRGRRSLPVALLIAAGTMVGACSQNSGSNLIPQIGRKSPDNYQPGQPYQLSKDELALNCRHLTGRMQVRILQIRDAEVRGGGSVIARTAQSATTPILGGTTRGADPAADVARDRAVLEAMNRQLAAKNCATFDLDAELQPRPVRDTPTPIPRK